MKISCSIKSIVFYLFVFPFTSPIHADSNLKTHEGYWIYGFEQSVFKACDGTNYWMWVPHEFKGKYKEDGFRNYVKVKGHLKSPDPENNMYSTLPSLQVIEIKHARDQC